MSAFIVNPNHISALVRWACRARVSVYHGDPTQRLDIAGNEQEICDILLTENVASRALPGYDDAPWEIKAKPELQS